jgi:predicted nuclease of restriction endonuclease-like (RecB) superfamily
MISRTKPIYNLKILIIPNPDLLDFIEIGKTYLQFKLENIDKEGSLFLNPLIQNMIIEW